MTAIVDEEKINKLLSLGISDVVVKDDLKKKLMSGKKLRVKLGIDPTGFDLHLGHMVVVHKLREFQELGHQVVIVFGNFTGQIGDPTGKDETRPLRTQEELENNAKHYLKQVSRVIDVKSVEVAWNADWLASLTFLDVVGLASQFTVAQMLERDMFQERIKKDKPIAVHEFMYPLMQGYDSVALKADVELGGTDQTFNLLAGRTIQRGYGQEPQNILTVPILVGTDGSMKMGKTTGNYIGVDEKPEEMFGKIMSIPDEVLMDYAELAARADTSELKRYQKRLKDGENPRDIKMELAQRIILIYHGEKAAIDAKDHFVTVFQKKDLPDEIEEQVVEPGEKSIVDLVFTLKFANSKSEARQKIQGGGVKVDGKKIDDINFKIKVPKKGANILIQVGKRRFCKIVFRNHDNKKT